MRISTIIKGIAATAMLSSFGAAHAAHVPSPCGAGETGAGTNCMYLTTTGATYNAVSGNRDATVGSNFSVGVWIDFGTLAVQGGGFDITFDSSAVTSYTWNWNSTVVAGFEGDEFDASEQTLDGSAGVGGWFGIQFDDFAGNGWGGSTGTENGFVLVGTLDIVGATADLLFSIAQPYSDATFPNCFAPGAASGAPAQCVATNFYSLNTTQVVPLPAAVWLMIAGLGSLAGFARRKA